MYIVFAVTSCWSDPTDKHGGAAAAHTQHDHPVRRQRHQQAGQEALRRQHTLRRHRGQSRAI